MGAKLIDRFRPQRRFSQGFLYVNFKTHALMHQCGYPRFDDVKLGYLFLVETDFAANRNAQRSVGVELDIVLCLIHGNILCKILVVVLGFKKVLRCNVQ
ncbi:hypothetical protein D3C84_1135460 [compost metagenome]